LSSRMPVSRSIPRASEVRATEETRVARPDSISSRLLGVAALGATTFLTLFGCSVPNNNAPAADTANPSVVDAGIADISAEAEISAAVAAPVTSIFRAGILETPLTINQAAQISFNLPEELKALFGQVKLFGVIGPRVDERDRSPFKVADFGEEQGLVSATITPLRGAEDSSWHLVLELGEGAEAKYVWYEFVVGGRTQPADAGTRRDGSRRRDDAGTTRPDAQSQPRDIARGETRPRI